MVEPLAKHAIASAMLPPDECKREAILPYVKSLCHCYIISVNIFSYPREIRSRGLKVHLIGSKDWNG